MFDNALQNQRQSIRVPVYSEEEYVPTAFSGGGGTPGQYYINCFPKTSRNAITGDGSVMISKRPPIKKTMSLSTHFSGSTSRPLANIGVLQLNDVMVCAIWDNSASGIRIIQYRPSANTSTLIGTISSSNTTSSVTPTEDDEVFITECELASGGSIVPGIAISWRKYNSTYSDGFYSISSSGVFGAASLSHITAASFPVTLGKIITGPFQQLNGIFYIMGIDGVIYGSGGAGGTVNDLTAWDSSNTIRCRQLPDAGVGVFRYKHHLVAFSNSSIEFFNDEGNAVPASALGVTEQAFIKFGTFSAKQVCTIEDSLYWVGYSNDSTVGIYKLDGYTAVKISNDHIDYSLVDSTAAKKSYLSILPINGKQHLIVNYLSIPWSLTLPNDTNNLSNTTDADTYESQNAELTQAYIVAYSISDKVWWAINNDWGDLQAIYPAQWTNYNYPARKTYCLQYSQYLENRAVYFLDETYNTETGFTDSDGASSETLRPYMCLVKFPLVSFGNSARKKISKALIPLIRYPNATSATTESMYLGQSTSNVGDANTGVKWYRKIFLKNASSVPELSPIYFNNLSMGRYHQFYIYYFGPGWFNPSALELTVHQGTH